MLAGGSDWSATDPWATSGTPKKWPPGWIIVWPFDPKATGLPGKPKNTGVWIILAGTPYAHLMINGEPWEPVGLRLDLLGNCSLRCSNSCIPALVRWRERGP
jgi:hypothetical protein